MQVLQNFKQLQIAEDLETIDESKDYGGGSYLEKPISPHLADYLYLKNYLLASSIEIFEEDVVKKNIIKLKSDEYNVQDIMDNLNKFRDEFSYAYGDYKQYGAGALKIIKTENSFILVHLPQSQLNIEKVEINGKLYPLVEQVMDYTVQSNDKKNKKFILYNQKYPEEILEYGIDGVLLWIGKSRQFNYYSIPFYIQNVPDMRNGIIIDALDEEQLKQGNNTNGVLIISKSGKRRLKSNDPNKKDEEEAPIIPSNVQIVKNALEKGGIGNAMLYDESDTPLEATYVSLSNSNNDYINSKIEASKNSIISRSKIPRERYMINDIKESMNSQKTLAFWDIYNVFIASEQNIIEDHSVALVEFLYGIPVEADMTTPIFEEMIALQIQVQLDLLNEGIITYGECSAEINRVKPSVPIISESDDRYYQYKDTTTEDIDLTGLTA